MAGLGLLETRRCLNIVNLKEVFLIINSSFKDLVQLIEGHGPTKYSCIRLHRGGYNGHS